MVYEGVAEDRLLERRNSRSRFLTEREKHRLMMQAAEIFRQVQAGSRRLGGVPPPPLHTEKIALLSLFHHIFDDFE